MQNINRLENTPIKYRGFTAIELIFALVIVAGIILASYTIHSNFIKSKKNNQLADEIKVYQYAAIKYINDNFRYIDQQTEQSTGTAGYKQDLIITATGLNGYYHQGALPVLSNYQTPCLYITKNISNQPGSGTKNPFEAYLVFGTTSTTNKVSSFPDAIAVARSFGGNAGVLVPESSGFSIQGMNDPGTIISYNLDIGAQCGFSGGHGASGLMDYSLIINLTQDKKLFSQIKVPTDMLSGNQDEDPSLKRTGTGDVVTMQTNLYLDNVVKESSSITNYFCDATQLPVADANSLCTSYASNSNISMYSGTASWVSSIITTDQQSCNATASAHFYSFTSTPTCNGVSFPDPVASGLCPTTHNGLTVVSGSGNWSPLPGQLNGNQCTSNAYASYQGCSWNCTAMCTNPMDQFGPKIPCTGSIPYGKATYPYDSTGTCKNMSLTCHDDSNGNVGSLYSGMITGTYNPSTGMCDVYFPTYCSNFAAQSNNPWQPFSPSASGSGTVSCGQGSMPAAAATTTVDLGFRNCSPSGTYPSLSSTTGVPAEHRYRALDFGAAVTAGQRVQIKSDAPAGAAVSSSQLDINNAGIQAGYVAPISTLVVAGSICAAVDLGTMAQQQYSTIVGGGGQLQCTYNPVFCGGNGYCYIPVKTPSLIYSYSTLQTIGSCPSGSVVAANQPPSGISSSVPCPTIGGLTLIQGLHGETTNCNEVVSGFSFCSSYQTLCNYRDSSGNTQKVVVAALAQLQCSSATSTFTVDNFTQ